MNHYVYYSYEEWGRGYIGSRSCKCLPAEDTRYMGSFKDRSFKPSQKVIIAEFPSRKDALEAEVLLHTFFEVDENPAFANKAKQTSSSFFFDRAGESLSETHKLRISESLTGKKRKPHSQETKAKITLALQGKSASEERKRKISESNKGREVSPETRRKISEAKKGTKMTQEAREKMSRSRTGVKRSPEVCEKIRQAAITRWAKKKNASCLQERVQRMD